MIRFESVTKIYRWKGGERRVLDQQSFTIERGRSIGLLGRNGAGKSTLTRLIAGVEHPNAGHITRSMSVSWPLGFHGAFQNSLTGADNARFIARIYGCPAIELMEAVQEFADLGPYFRLPVKTYSSGMQARLAFAISLAVKFDCYLVDEVTAVGDVRFRERCRQALVERRQDGTLIMISHDLEVLREYCDSGALLQGGRLTWFDTIDDAITAYITTLERNAP